VIFGAAAPVRYDQYLRRTVNTPFFSLTMNIRNTTRTELILRQREHAILRKLRIGRRRRTSLPLEPAIGLDQQLGKSLDKDFGEAAGRNLAHDTTTTFR
jgi:hypothetical protein